MNRPPAPDGGEFGFIARHFAPLARGEPGAFDLTDDAAVLTPEPGRQTVVTTDVLVSGVHFLPDTPPADVAHKALSVNLSDLAAMGARADAYTLGVAVPRGADSPDDAWWDAFCGRLAALQAHTGVVLVGGDTVSTPGPLSLSVTALGSVPAGRALRRAGAAAGDLVCLSGTVGDAALG
ncbi:MAG: thiamine-monophosphate kinase, partial [Rhodobacterales bacterium]|nr:thiamine-monophosphate kinase [Rhodobacterales bacterium]